MAGLDEFLPNHESGNRTSIHLAAHPDATWEALHATTFGECRLTLGLLAARALPRWLRRRSTYARERLALARDIPILETMRRRRFIQLAEEQGREIVLGIVGQFWKADGGIDAEIGTAEEFLEFEEPGFVKSVVSFRVEAEGVGSRLSTETRNRATDPKISRTFGRYWRLIGWGSKLIRWDILLAVRRRAGGV